MLPKRHPSIRTSPLAALSLCVESPCTVKDKFHNDNIGILALAVGEEIKKENLECLNLDHTHAASHYGHSMHNVEVRDLPVFNISLGEAFEPIYQCQK